MNCIKNAAGDPDGWTYGLVSTVQDGISELVTGGPHMTVSGSGSLTADDIAHLKNLLIGPVELHDYEYARQRGWSIWRDVDAMQARRGAGTSAVAS